MRPPRAPQLVREKRSRPGDGLTKALFGRDRAEPPTLLFEILTIPAREVRRATGVHSGQYAAAT
jgi:hypothetical protein